MRKTIFTIVVAASFIAGSIFTGCQSSAQKEEAAREKSEDANEEFEDLQNEQNAENQKVATAAEWEIFKTESELKIRNNEIRVEELKIQMNKPGKVFDAIYARKIEILEQRNRNMQARIDAYEASQSNWEVFKREFNHDMDELGKAFKDLTVDNKK